MGNQKKNVIDYALNYIFKYPKTEKELVIQLRKKGYNEDYIHIAIEYLKERNYLNDKIFIKDYVFYHLIKKGKPIIYVKSQLKQKGLNMYDIKEIIGEYINDINEGIEKQIRREIDKYKTQGENQFDIIQKIIRKGYTLNQLKKVINNKVD